MSSTDDEMADDKDDEDEDEDEDEVSIFEIAGRSCGSSSKPSGIVISNCFSSAAADADAARSSRVGSHGFSQTLHTLAEGGLRKVHELQAHFL